MLCDLRQFVKNEADAREKLAQFASNHALVDEIDLSRNALATLNHDWFWPFLSVSRLMLDANGPLGRLTFSHESLRELSLRECGLQSLTVRCPNLELLDLTTNQLTVMDPSIFLCSKLKKLYMPNNDLRELLGIENMQELTELNVQNNPRLWLMQVENPKRLEKIPVLLVKGTQLARSFGLDQRRLGDVHYVRKQHRGPNEIPGSWTQGCFGLASRWQAQRRVLTMYACLRFQSTKLGHRIPRDVCQLLARIVWQQGYELPPIETLTPPPPTLFRSFAWGG